MSTLSTSPARPMGKVELSRLTLAGSSVIVSTVLVVWLLVCPLFGPPRRFPRLLTVSLGAPETLPGAAAVMARDGRQLSEQAREGASTREWGQAVEELLAGAREPVVIYLAAVGVSAPSDREGTRAFVLTADTPLGSKKALVSVADLLNLLEQKKGTPRLLILDAGRVGSDRDLGVFGNGFLNQLAPLLRRDGNLVVLTSCAPGQESWAAERGRGSVFARSVAEGLSGKAARWGQVTVQSLYRHVVSDVSQWAERYRDGAVQTPLLLGNDTLDFPLPRLTLPHAPSGAETESIPVAIRDELKRQWDDRAALAEQSPYRHAPLAWSRYQNALLRAERLARSGDSEAAARAIDSARALKTRVESLLSGPSLARPHSLALVEARSRTASQAGSVSADQTAAYRRTIEQAIEGTTDDGAEGSDEAPAKAGDRPPTKEKTEKPASETANAAPAAGAAAKEAPAPKPIAGEDGKASPVKTVPRASPAVARLTGGSPDGPPTFVEGQLALWYVRFVDIGGETEALKPTRLGLLRRALTVRSKAEQAAAGALSTLRVRGLVDEGDARRRQAQDRLFAAEPALIKDADTGLLSAQASYDRAVALAGQLARANDLVDRLQDMLPYLGNWQANRPDGMDDSFEDLLSAAADLAKIVDEAPGPDKAGEPDSGDRVLKMVEKLEPALTQLVTEFRSAVDRANRKSSGSGWRELDALLRVPMIAADDRLALLDRLAAPEAADRPETDSARAAAAGTDPDPGFWRRARDLARLEWGLLKLGGLDVTELAEWQGQAWSYREKNPSLAFDTLDRFSARVRELRAGLTSASRGATDRDPVAPAGQTVADLLKGLVAADRSARALPAPWVVGVAEDPARKLDEFQLHALLVWHAQRLNDDFAPGHAVRLLDDARQIAGSKDLWDERVRARQFLEAQLVVKTMNVDAQQEGVTVRVGSEGELPRGEAALLNAHDPAIALDGAVSGGGSLIAVPLPTGQPASRVLSLTPAARRLATAGRVLVPEVFYRGRRYAAEGVALPDHQKLVKVELRQQRLLGRYPDQFIEHPAKGYLRTRTSLDYKLLITNLTPRPIHAVVTYGLEGEVTETGKITLASKAHNDTIKGSIATFDLPDDTKSRILVISVNEDSPDGRPLCEPLKVPFRKVNPKEFIVAEPGFGGGEFFVYVTHLHGPDPIPLPVPVTVKVEPANAFLEIRNNMAFVERGGLKKIRFQILTPVKKVKWTVSAEGVPDVVVGDFVFEE